MSDDPRKSRRRLAVLTAAVLAAVLVVLLLLHSESLPPDLAPPAGRYDVRILRDVWGVPHVFGRTDADAAYGLAWAHAEDDFATVQGALLAARGNLASVYGRAMAPNDYMVALLDVGPIVAAGYPEVAPDVRAVCEAYAAGVNHYATLHPDQAIARLYPVRGDDVVRGFVHKMPLFFGLDRVLTELFANERRHPVSAEIRGSNAFAVAPSRTADGGTFLVVNSHQPWEGPVAWYEAHLHSEEGWDMVGGVFPGSPVVLHGHNRHLGWAHTVNRPDLVDVYVLTTDPDDPDRYRFDGQWRRLEKASAPIEVRLLGPLRWTFRREILDSVHGPAVRRPHGTYALRIASYGEVGQVEQWFRMNKAKSFDEWRDAMRRTAIPMLNTIYADREGNVFYVYNGRLPKRSARWDWSEYLPGDTSETLWTEHLAFDELPQVLNPASGFVQNSNSSPFQTTAGPENPRAEDYPASLGIETGMTNRSLRARELLGADTSITFDELVAYKLDTAYSRRSKMARLVGRAVARRPASDPALDEALATLARWDLDTRVDDRQAALAVLAFGRFIDSGDNDAEPTDDELLAALREASATLRKFHGGLEVPWGEVNRLRRGAVDLPVGGAPDVLRAVYGRPTDDGHLRGVAGDSYVLIAAWDAAGRVRSLSIHQYGSATLDPSSPHYADQAPLFVEPRLKPVWMDEAEIRAHLEREYRPGEEHPEGSIRP